MPQDVAQAAIQENAELRTRLVDCWRSFGDPGWMPIFNRRIEPGIICDRGMKRGAGDCLLAWPDEALLLKSEISVAQYALYISPSGVMPSKQ